MAPVKPCRNCGNTEFFYSDVVFDDMQKPNLLPVFGMLTRPMFIMKVCGDCGIVDYFVPTPIMPIVREKFERNVEASRKRKTRQPNQPPLPTPGKCPPSNQDQLPGAADL